jgi:hypothetical protein
LALHTDAYYQLFSCKDKAIHGPYTKASPNTVFCAKAPGQRLKAAEFFEAQRSLYNHAAAKPAASHKAGAKLINRSFTRRLRHIKDSNRTLNRLLSRSNGSDKDWTRVFVAFSYGSCGSGSVFPRLSLLCSMTEPGGYPKGALK